MKFSAQPWQQCMQKGKVLLKDEKKRANLLVCLGVAGMLLLALSEWKPQEEPSSATITEGSVTTSPATYTAQLQEQLCGLISRVEGVGKVEVMVTLARGEESVYATDNQTASDGSLSVSHVLLGESGLVETVQTPQVLGVAVVCEGGGNAAVQNRVSEIVQALTGVKSNHITVAQMAATE